MSSADINHICLQGKTLINHGRSGNFTSLHGRLVSVVLLALLLDSGMSLVLPMDCSDIYNHSSSRPSGVYTIYPIGSTSAVQVYCDMDSLDGRWTVFQRRMDGSVNFYRPWDHYKTGFGNAVGEYWLGLETLSHLTLRKNYELLVDMEDFDGAKFSLGTPRSPWTPSPPGSL
ncbi:hypothetical protein F7725_012073 [Dissostichus mawsoni]|uniref:Fibrinogen C-terminal domain-containing protein n=1 Tax=Dissostichus mawsoni TaxID=36200 RepID=A0A7J5ZAN0_DISMA|nr:hypothetical protein F7725_012073 [Dissostichus mawsoni]